MIMSAIENIPDQVMVTCHINEDRIFVTGSHVVMRDALEETKKKT